MTAKQSVFGGEGFETYSFRTSLAILLHKAQKVFESLQK
jgi:hypothetical protein